MHAATGRERSLRTPATRLGRWLLAALFVLAAGIARGEDDAIVQFYRGKQVTIIVGSSAGGGYDIYARLLARHLPRHIPGEPSVIVTNMPGAASNTAGAYIYNVAPRDGTVIGALQTAAVLDPLFGDPARMKHDATKFVHVGSATIDYYVCIARADAAVKSFKDLLDHELILGSSQVGTSTHDFPALLNSAVGTKFRIVSGYPGTREITLAIEKGEVQGLCGFSWSSLQAEHANWLASGFIRILAQEHDKGHPALNRMGVPLTVDFAKSPASRRIMELIYSSETFGRPYMMAPGVPAERVAALRKAFIDTLRDEVLIAEATRIGLDVEPISGGELQALAARIYSTPADIVEQARQAVNYRAP
jgi:tripartite-type tricarboxylate transporter receptor subunit TctC